MDTKADSTVYSKICPAQQILDRIADKWTTLIMGILSEAEGPVRFREFRHRIEGISQKMLTQTLRDLERDGLVVRRVFPVIPPRVEYSMTPLGRTLEAPLAALAAWTVEHMAQVHVAQIAFDRTHPKNASAAVQLHQ
jgi:DNA-binding HxlR family transcriptional regulator